MTERDIIDRLLERVGVPGGQVVLGIGDDCAIFRPRGSREDLLFTTDLMVEGVHFRKGDALRRIGHKALARGLSDIAAMGGSPRFCLLSLALPSAPMADAIFSGLLELARKTGTVLIGGDISRSRVLTLDIVVCGAVPQGRALRRDGASIGDGIYVSGPLGRAASRDYRDLPTPRLSCGKKLLGHATACMDLSDGLSIDLQRLCLASSVSAELDWVPLANGATLENALHGGEDYELLFTGRNLESLPGALPVGRIVAGIVGQVSYRGKVLPALGHDHFALKH